MLLSWKDATCDANDVVTELKEVSDKFDDYALTVS